MSLLDDLLNDAVKSSYERNKRKMYSNALTGSGMTFNPRRDSVEALSGSGMTFNPNDKPESLFGLDMTFQDPYQQLLLNQYLSKKQNTMGLLGQQ